MDILNGHDIGNQADKQAFIDQSGQMVVRSVENKIGAGGVAEFNVSLSGSIGKRGRAAQDRPDVVVYDGGVTVMVGANVEQFTRRPIRRTDLNRYSDGMATRAVTYDSWYRLMGPGEHTLKTALGLPVQLINGPDYRARWIEIRHWLRNEHVFTVNGEECRVMVEKVKPLPQPAGAFADFALDERGQIRDPELMEVEIAVLDQGYHTLDLFVLERGQVSRTYTAGDGLGMREAVRLLMLQIEQMHGRKVNEFEADRMIVEHTQRPNAEIAITAGGTAVNVTPIVQAAVNTATDQAMMFLDEVWGDNGRQFRHILLVGGGSLVMANALRQKYPHAVFLPDPINANARGLAKIAQSGIFS